MFEKVVLRRSQGGSAITIGELAEAILFYQNVHIVLDYGSLNGLIQKIGMPELLSLLSRPNISAIYCEETLGTKTDKQISGSIHQFVAFMMAGNQDVGQLTSRKKRLEFIVERQGYPKKQARKLVDRFRRHVTIRKMTDNYFVEGGIINAAWDDINDPEFVHEAMRQVLIRELGNNIISKDFSFNILPNHPKFQIVTNINFDNINIQRKIKKPTAGDMSPAHFINEILEARADTMLASHYGGEFYTSDTASTIIQLKHRELLRRIGIEKNELREFQEVVLDQAPSLRETINSGQRSFKEFLTLLDKSIKFKEWSQGVNPDGKLVKEYFQEVTSEGWISSLPIKTLRYAIGAVMTAIEPISGTIGSLADSLITEKLLTGWRPSHFVEKQLRPFLEMNK